MAPSSITVARLEYGVERSADVAGNRRAVDAFLSVVTVPSFDRAAPMHAGEIRARLGGRRLAFEHMFE